MELRISLIVLLVFAVDCGTGEQHTPRPPHIIIILADDLGWNDVSFHGSGQIVTPNIDALAYRGVILQRHYALPTCSPSRSALLTGRYPIRTGVQSPIPAGTTSALGLNHTLLPEHLQRLGYRTHLVGKWHLGSHRSEFLPTRRGFHSHFGFWNGFLGYYDGMHAQSDMQVVAGIDARRNEQGAWQEFVGTYLTDLITKESAAVIGAHPADQPLYLQVALSAPHAGNRGAELQVRDVADNAKRHAHIGDPLRALYAGMVTGVDDAVGGILEALSAKGLLQNSIVLFSSDNGAPTQDPIWGYHNHGSNWPLRGMKCSCHDGGVRVAAALWSPLVPGGRVSDQLIHMVDWLPTLYSAAGGDVSALGQIDGVSHWEWMSGGESGRAPARQELLVDLDPLGSGNEALIRWPWKLVRYTSKRSALSVFAGESGRGPETPEYSPQSVAGSPAARVLGQLSPPEMLALRQSATIQHRCALVEANGTEGVRPCTGDYCLFDLDADPCETTDLAASHAATVVELRAALEGYGASAVPSEQWTVDPRSHPTLWANAWAPWADALGGAAEARPWALPLVLLAAGSTLHNARWSWS